MIWSLSLRVVLAGSLCLISGLPLAQAQQAEARSASSGRVEVALAHEYRGQKEAIKQDFAQVGLSNIHVQFQREGQPPTNIGLGAEVPAEKARDAIRLAVKYNRAVTILLPERLFPSRFVTIASSNFDDTVEHPIGGQDLERLMDPSLSTEQFHALYRELTQGKTLPSGRY
jgi:hypothetical protein